jgi:hypothetical protein
MLCATLFVACTRGDPPKYTGAVDSVEPIPPAPVRDADIDVTPDVWIDPGTLPQTRDMPAPTGAVETRAAALWDAIVNDDPDRAMPFFFPVGAYEQTKAITNPAVDWKHRLIGNYLRDIHATARACATRSMVARRRST